jgi:thiol-disulfide isomerase/thioredoxin
MPSKSEASTELRWVPALAQVAFVVVAALFVFGFVTVSKEGEARRVCSAPCALRPDYLGAERRAPSFVLKDMRGESVALESLRGKVVVLNFWSKTCGPCLEEMPDLAELAKIVRDRPDVAILAVSTDEGPDDIKDTLQTVFHEAPPFRILFDSDLKVVRDKYGTRLFPETWFIDKEGIIRARFDSARDWTNPLVVNFIDALRGGEYCPVKIDARNLGGKDGRICEEFGGS